MAQIITSTNAFDAISVAGSISIPWTIVHCIGDRTVPVSHARRLFDARKDRVGDHGLRSVITSCSDHLVPFPLWEKAIKGVISQNAFHE